MLRLPLEQIKIIPNDINIKYCVRGSNFTEFLTVCVSNLDVLYLLDLYIVKVISWPCNLNAGNNKEFEVKDVINGSISYQYVDKYNSNNIYLSMCINTFDIYVNKNDSKEEETYELYINEYLNLLSFDKQLDKLKFDCGTKGYDGYKGLRSYMKFITTMRNDIFTQLINMESNYPCSKMLVDL
jgi:hypothetical protein